MQLHFSNNQKRLIILLITILMIILIVVGIYSFWLTHRPLPPAMNREPLFKGIFYTREIRTEPIPKIIHVVEIDLTDPYISFLVTPKDDIEGFVHRARTSSQFLDEFDLQVAINADFFDPWKDYGPFNYYPRVGQGTNIRGQAISQGKWVSGGYGDDFVTMFISADNQVSFNQPEIALSGMAYNAISGNLMLLEDSKIREYDYHPYLAERHPRTAVGLSQDEKTLFFVLVDGRQPNYSQGATIPELAQIMLDYGAYTAMNLDGGGSSTLVMEAVSGAPVQLNSAIHNRIPARERPIANHLGVYSLALR